jgi:hypothetical protein
VVAALARFGEVGQIAGFRILSDLLSNVAKHSPNCWSYKSQSTFDSPFYVGHINRQNQREDAMANPKPAGSGRRLSRRTLLQESAAALGAAAFPLPAIAQTKPFAGVTLHGASFQHRFFTLLQPTFPSSRTRPE